MNSTESLRKLHAVIQRLNSAQGWEQETDQAAQIQKELLKLLPAPLGHACTAWRENDGTLVIACPNGALAGKLRHLAPRIMHQIRATDAQVTAIRIEVQAKTWKEIPRETRSTRVEVDAGVVDGLTGLADSMAPGDLPDALRRLAGHLREGRRNGAD